jgi:hypothetical protein
MLAQSKHPKCQSPCGFGPYFLILETTGLIDGLAMLGGAPNCTNKNINRKNLVVFQRVLNEWLIILRTTELSCRIR